MNYAECNVTFNEIPHEISLVFSITGCGGKCKGCHSPFLHDPNNGTRLTKDFYISQLIENKGMVTTVLFLGGDWEEDNLIEFLKLAKKFNYKTGLYTRLNYEEVSRKLKYHLTYLKVGPYMEGLGGLESVITNQKLYQLKPVKKDITSLFWQQAKPKIK